MPIVNILVTREGTAPGADRTTAKQKAAIYHGIADLLFDVMGKPREDTTVIFHEHEMEDLGQGGLPLTDYRARRAQERQASA
ncbi:tautomerase family protein [Sphingomonas morindae]|uniref:4-oxalocrotonate tautomerase family protein n=1 Tax=Sphingomonas morindae TaxID=1541170 RepID=A0ABY4X7J1_9SPHN|nr:4-oxalocrotonate tautomerase family protein [Sphingomonas morindae]USI72892.1 4-oxalocrotonate tautomerase family protein [Sphingomonas morindae]